MTDDDDLFAVRPAKSANSETKVAPQPKPKIEPICQPTPAKPARRPAKPDHVPEVSEMVLQPSGRVASFSCVCGGQDEVREPAPRTVLCWNCKPPRRMKRWNPGYDTPHVSARELTAAEREGMSSRPG
jgi:hypothetical protein